jgi:hypothetical protein
LPIVAADTRCNTIKAGVDHLAVQVSKQWQKARGQMAPHNRDATPSDRIFPADGGIPAYNSGMLENRIADLPHPDRQTQQDAPKTNRSMLILCGKRNGKKGSQT